MKRILFGDIETHGLERRWDMSPREFFRLGQYAINDGPVILTTDYDEFLGQVRSADLVVFHNGHSFDLSVLFGKDSLEPLHMAQQGKVLDTLVASTLLLPAPYEFTMSNGRYVKDAGHPGVAMLWFGLDNLCYQHGLEGKFGDLRELAKKYNPPRTRNDDLDFGAIPLDDPDFLEYARQDVIAVRDLYKFLILVQNEVKYDEDYLAREQEIHAILAQISRNGIRPNIKLAKERSAAQQQIVDDTMEWLVQEFDFPIQGKAPWKSDAGKAAILKALAAYDITPDHPEWERTAKGNPSFSGDTMIAVTKDSPAEELGAALAQLQGLRSMPDLILGSVRGCGRMHPDFSAFQKSGRFSVYNPSILIINREHKDLLLADDGCFTVELDFSNADARAVAAMSGDTEFAKRFEPGQDGHNLSGEVFFGYDLYHADCEGGCPSDCRPALRPAAKALALALGYNVGPRKAAQLLNKAAKEAGLDIEFWCSDETYWQYRNEVSNPMSEGEWLDTIREEGKIHTRELVRNYNLSYAGVKRWKGRVVEEGDRDGFVTNAWGRRMTIDFAGADWDAPVGRRSKSYTQSPALLGQSTTREMMGDFLIKMGRKGPRWVRALRGIIHDAVVVDFPQETFKEDVGIVQGLMQSTLHGEIDIEFPAGVGPLDGLDWKEGSD